MWERYEDAPKPHNRVSPFRYRTYGRDMRLPHRTLASGIALPAVLILALAACSSSDSATPGSADPTTTSSAVDTTAAVEAGLWSDTITVTIGDDGTWNYSSDGVPDHELPDQFLIPIGAPDPSVDQPEVVATDTSEVVTANVVDFDIPLNPVYSETVTENDLGTIGVSISGAHYYNDYEDQERSLIALDDNFTIDGVSFIDSCNGHPLADGGEYHYHGVPYCITDDVDVEGEHSTMIGVMLDGFPIYGPTDEDGVAVDRADLDECNGEFGPTPEFPEGIYHYHIMEDMSPYMPDCYHGEITLEENAAPGGAAPAAPDLTEAAATLGVTVDELNAALGQPPYDLDAAAEILGLTPEELEAAIPAGPNGN